MFFIILKIIIYINNKVKTLNVKGYLINLFIKKSYLKYIT